MNYLYYGNNLDVLREHFSAESVDLIYLEPPFNSDQNYNARRKRCQEPFIDNFGSFG